MSVTIAMPEWLAITVGVLLLVSSALNLVNVVLSDKLARMRREDDDA